MAFKVPSDPKRSVEKVSRSIPALVPVPQPAAPGRMLPTPADVTHPACRPAEIALAAEGVGVATVGISAPLTAVSSSEAASVLLVPQVKVLLLLKGKGEKYIR